MAAERVLANILKSCFQDLTPLNSINYNFVAKYELITEVMRSTK